MDKNIIDKNKTEKIRKKKKKKISILQIVRLAVQILCFIFLPAIYQGAFNGIKEIYTAVIHLDFTPSILFQLVEVTAVVPVTILLGRFFCGWMCAFGSFSDFIFGVSKLVSKKNFVIPEKVDAWLKYVKYVLLVFLVVVSWSFNLTFMKTANPWDVFGMLATVGKMPDFKYVISNLTIGLILFLVIAIVSVFYERFFCRYLCPMGAIFALLSKFRIAKIRKPSAKCGKCRICTTHCAMGIPLYKYETVSSTECINCMKCIEVCPRSNTDFTIAGSDVRPLLAGTAAVAVMTGMYYSDYYIVMNAGNNGNISTISQTSQSAAENKLYRDGTYEGTGSGFRGGTTQISVTVKNDRIVNISTVSYQDDEPFYNKAYQIVSGEILNTQSADVDAVSGATFSSNGIMEAVANALEQAKITGNSSVVSSTIGDVSSDTGTIKTNSTPSNGASSDSIPSGNNSSSFSASSAASSTGNPSSSSQKNSSAQNSSTVKSNTSSQTSSVVTGQYQDGTYQGSGYGYRGITCVTVTVSNGLITDIQIDSTRDDREFFNRAYSGVSSAIIQNQSTAVDAVSGATFSSNGIMEAVADALKAAIK